MTPQEIQQALTQIGIVLAKLKVIIAGLLIAGSVATPLPPIQSEELTLGGVGDIQVSTFQETAKEYKIEKLSNLPEGGMNRTLVNKTKPEITLEKWNGEVSLKIAYNDITAPATKISKLGAIGGAETIEYKNTKQELHAYPLPAGEGMEDGGFEIEVVLNEKPTTNVFEFQLSGWEDLDFWYQPKMSQERINRGAFQPENVVGSYAVYHKTKANHRVGDVNFATGKFFHWYRPRVVDANGYWVWIELSYDEKFGIMSNIIPQSFLDTATYPIKF